MKKRTKALAVALSLVLAVGCVVGGSLAWLTATSGPVKNTFTYGDVDIALKESENLDLTILPGVDIKKDPKITVSTPRGAAPVDSYVFVKVEETNWPAYKDGKDRKVDYEMAAGWNKLTGVKGVDNVWYRVVTADAEVKSFPVLKDNKVTVSGTLTKAEIEAAFAKQPTLTFTAYAVQQDGMDNVQDAWSKVK